MQTHVAWDSVAASVESFLADATRPGPLRFNAQLVGKVEFRAGEGPLFELRGRTVEVEASWSGALFSSSIGDDSEIATMPLNMFSLHVVCGNIRLMPA